MDLLTQTTQTSIYMEPTPYLLYSVLLKNHLSVRDVLELANSKRSVVIDPKPNGTALKQFSGFECEYISWLIGIELTHLHIYDELRYYAEEELIAFLHKYSITRTWLLKSIFQAIYRGIKCV